MEIPGNRPYISPTEVRFRRIDMNRQYARPVDEVADEFDFEMDLRLATRSRVPVLISGSPRSALMMAQAIAGRVARADRNIRVVSCDAASSDDLGAAFAGLESQTSDSAGG